MSISKSLVRATQSDSETQTLEPTSQQRYGGGPIKFIEADQGLYDRHLMFDNVMPVEGTGASEWFEETRAALDLTFSDHFSRDEPGVANPALEPSVSVRV